MQGLWSSHSPVSGKEMIPLGSGPSLRQWLGHVHKQLGHDEMEGNLYKSLMLVSAFYLSWNARAKM